MKQVIDGKMYAIKEPPVNTIEERLQRMEDLRAIEECIYHYAWACDNIDPVGMSSCFTETGRLSWGDVVPDVVCGRAAILEHLQSLLGAALTQTHLMTNPQILFVTNDKALAHYQMYSWQTFKDDNVPDCYSYGRYEAEVVRDTDGEWRFESFKFILAGTLSGCEFDKNGRHSEQFGRAWPLIPIPPRA